MDIKKAKNFSKNSIYAPPINAGMGAFEISELLNFLKHLVHNFIPLYTCRFGLNIFLVLFFAWETLCPYITPFPQLSHFIPLMFEVCYHYSVDFSNGIFEFVILIFSSI